MFSLLMGRTLFLSHLDTPKPYRSPVRPLFGTKQTHPPQHSQDPLFGVSIDSPLEVIRGVRALPLPAGAARALALCTAAGAVWSPGTTGPLWDETARDSEGFTRNWFAMCVKLQLCF